MNEAGTARLIQHMRRENDKKPSPKCGVRFREYLNRRIFVSRKNQAIQAGKCRHELMTLIRVHRVQQLFSLLNQ